MTIEKAKILDGILTRFKGNVHVKWSDLQTELGQTREYFITENNIKYLLGEGLLRENEFDKDLAMTDKGFAVYTDLETLGYLAKAKKEQRDNSIKNIGFIITVLTFILLLLRTFTNSDKPTNSDQLPVQDSLGAVVPDNSNQDSPVGLKIEGSRIAFDDGFSFQTNIYDLDFIGQLKSLRKRPFLILTGVQCDSCDAAVSIYLVSPSDGPLQTEDKQKRYSLPGRLRTYDTGEFIYEGRAFWGEVIPKRTGVIWFQKELNQEKKWVESVFFAELVNDTIEEHSITADIGTTLSQVKSGRAWEIPGSDMTSEP